MDLYKLLNIQGRSGILQRFSAAIAGIGIRVCKGQQPKYKQI